MNLIFQAALNVVLPGIPNVLEADLARLSMVDSLLLEVALVLDNLDFTCIPFIEGKALQ